MKDPYAVLGVSKNATDEEIKNAGVDMKYQVGTSQTKFTLQLTATVS